MAGQAELWHICVFIVAEGMEMGRRAGGCQREGGTCRGAAMGAVCVCCCRVGVADARKRERERRRDLQIWLYLQISCQKSHLERTRTSQRNDSRSAC